MLISAKFASVCPACQVRITPGARVEWSKGSPARHVACATTAPRATSPVLTGEAFKAEYQRRLAADRCLSSNGGRFYCSNIVAPSIRALGCCVCDDCDRREEERAADCDARQQRKMSGEW